jgi:hypothetical protein
MIYISVLLMVPIGEDAIKDLIETIGKDAPAYVLEA